MNVKGKKVLISGASTGIGKGTAEAFAKKGAKGCLLARTGKSVKRSRGRD